MFTMNSALGIKQAVAPMKYDVQCEAVEDFDGLFGGNALTTGLIQPDPFVLCLLFRSTVLEIRLVRLGPFCEPFRDF